MGLIADAWTKVNLVRRDRRNAHDTTDFEEGRLAWVREHAPGHSFADIGGLYKYMGDVSFLAEECGASQVTLFDVGDPDLPARTNLEWGSFDEKRTQRGSSVRFVQGDFEDPVAVDRIGVHDHVFYSGVLYHTPNPFRQLVHLRQITGKLAYLSTLTLPDIPGFPQACIFYPYLSERDRRAYGNAYAGRPNLLAIVKPFDDTPMHGFANNWWGITRSALVAMLRAARLEVVQERRQGRAPYITELIVRPIDMDPSLPPLSYFRERGEALDRGEPRWSFDTWYEEQRAKADGDGAQHEAGPTAP